MSTYGQGNVKIYPRKLRWRWNCEYLAQRIFPSLQYAFLFTVLWYSKPNKSKNYTGISFIIWFCWKSKDFKIQSSVRITEGLDNGDSDNWGPTVLSERWGNCFILSTEHLWRYTYKCITSGGPLPRTCKRFALSIQLYCSAAYKTLLANQYWCCISRKTSLKLIHYCILLSMVRHFDVHIITLHFTFCNKTGC